MKKEEAIQWLTDIKENITENWSHDVAIDMAIEALSQPIVAKHYDIQSGLIYCSPQDAENVKVVVRCKDCRYRELDGEVTHFYWCRINERPVDDDDFCAWGEESVVEKCRQITEK